MKSSKSPHCATIFVCTKSNCCRKGGDKVRSELKAAIKEAGLKKEVRVVESGCLDQCKKGPALLVAPANQVFCEVKPSDVEDLLEAVAAAYLQQA